MAPGGGRVHLDLKEASFLLEESEESFRELGAWDEKCGAVVRVTGLSWKGSLSKYTLQIHKNTDSSISGLGPSLLIPCSQGWVAFW